MKPVKQFGSNVSVENGAKQAMCDFGKLQNMRLPAPKRFLRYSLQNLFLLFTAFAVWLGVQVQWMRERQRFRDLTGAVHPCGEQIAPWSLRRLGETGVAQIWYVRYSEPGYSEQQIRALFPDAHVLFDDYRKTRRKH